MRCEAFCQESRAHLFRFVNCIHSFTQMSCAVCEGSACECDIRIAYSRCYLNACCQKNNTTAVLKTACVASYFSARCSFCLSFPHVAMIGLLYPCIDSRLGEPHKFKREWSSVMRCVAVFVGINHASAVSLKIWGFIHLFLFILLLVGKNKHSKTLRGYNISPVNVVYTNIELVELFYLL